jgi:indole-3-glycerol phosphate synthase
MSTILDRIVASKRAAIAERRSRLSEGDLARAVAAAPPVRDFEAALRRPGMQVIAR